MNISEKTIVALAKNRTLNDNQFYELINTDKFDNILYSIADNVRKEYYGNEVYLRGLIEFTNYCKNNCYYCGIRRGNKNAERYRLSKEEILECCADGYRLGFRTFVLQGGEDPYFTDERVVEIVEEIKAR